MPQFAVITRPFRVLATNEDKGAAKTVQMSLGTNRKRTNCVFEKPKAYLVSAVDAGAAITIVQRIAMSTGIDLIVHRAIEVCGTIRLGEPLLQRKD